MEPKAAEELVRRLASALRGADLYSATHPLVQRGIDALSAAALEGLPRGSASLIGFARDLRERQIEKLTLSRGLTRDEIRSFVAALGERKSPVPLLDRVTARGVRHIALGRIVIE